MRKTVFTGVMLLGMIASMAADAATPRKKPAAKKRTATTTATALKLPKNNPAASSLCILRAQEPYHGTVEDWSTGKQIHYTLDPSQPVGAIIYEGEIMYLNVPVALSLKAEYPRVDYTCNWNSSKLIPLSELPQFTMTAGANPAEMVFKKGDDTVTISFRQYRPTASNSRKVREVFGKRVFNEFKSVTVEQGGKILEFSAADLSQIYSISTIGVALAHDKDIVIYGTGVNRQQAGSDYNAPYTDGEYQFAWLVKDGQLKSLLYWYFVP